MDGAVRNTYLWQNGMVMTFGEDGEQIPELQGRRSSELLSAIRQRSTPSTEWHGFGEDGPCNWHYRDGTPRPVTFRP